MGRVGGQEVRLRVDNAPACPTEKDSVYRKEPVDLKNGTGHVPDVDLFQLAAVSNGNNGLSVPGSTS